VAVIGVYDGQERNKFFRYENEELQEKGERLLEEGDVAVLGPNAIHAIANPLSTVSEFQELFTSMVVILSINLIAACGTHTLTNAKIMTYRD
jgi:predicted metal-dependent enzyme (double-stranded beta helix superfamily)